MIVSVAVIAFVFGFFIGMVYAAHNIEEGGE